MPHRTMNIAELEALARRRESIRILMYTSEAVVAAMLFVWGLQMTQIQRWQYDPITEALKQFTPWIAPNVHGGALMIVTALHAYFMVHAQPGWRRHLIAAEMGFLFFVEYNLVFAFFKSHLFIPGVYGVPVLILFSIVNHISLVKPKSQESGECKVDR